MTRWLGRVYGYRTAAIRTKWVIFILFGLGALAFWSGSEAVLPAYLVGMVLAETREGDALWVTAAPDVDGRLSHAFLFSSGRHAGFPSRPDFGAFYIFVLLAGKVCQRYSDCIPSSAFSYTNIKNGGITP